MNPKILLIQPPFSQFSSPYPAVFYLKSYLKTLDFESQTYDFNILLIRRIFSKPGLEKIFAKIEQNFEKKKEFYEEKTSEFYYFYFLHKEYYLKYIDEIIDFLSGNSYNTAKMLNLLHLVPAGQRISNFFEHTIIKPDIQTARIVFSLMLDEIGDFIRIFYDQNFHMVHYQYTMNNPYKNFEDIENMIFTSEILNEFYKPLLDEILDEQELLRYRNLIFCLSLPFTGTVLPGFFTAKYIKSKYPENSLVLGGGGFVSTELRDLKNPKPMDYFDFLIFDKGLNSLKTIVESDQTGELDFHKLYKTLLKDEQKIFCINFPENEHFGNKKNFDSQKIFHFFRSDNLNELEQLEKKYVQIIYPDYSSVDYSPYLCLNESGLPMSSIWSAHKWLKCYTSYGCYWKKCLFCDIQLDYINNYTSVSLEGLFDKMIDNAGKTGIKQIHFTDETIPLKNLIRFSFYNAQHNFPFTFWGNIRFDKHLDYDTSSFLAHCGFLGATIGGETLVSESLSAMEKGINIEQAIKMCFALKDNGILVHLYLIYGMIQQSEQEIINGLEILRQLFSSGIIDSAFWHKFVLTRHSGFLKKILNKEDPGFAKELIIYPENDFAGNDLRFQGEEAYNRFDSGLTKALQNFMEFRGLDTPVEKWFSFHIVNQDIQPDFVEKILENYTNDIELNEYTFEKKICWLGSKMAVVPIDEYNSELIWYFRDDKKRIKISGKWAYFIKNILNTHGPENLDKNLTIKEFSSAFQKELGIQFESFMQSKNFLKLKKNGLVFLRFI